jgi:hypothetical protein
VVFKVRKALPVVHKVPKEMLDRKDLPDRRV